MHRVQEAADPRPLDMEATSGEEYHLYRLNEHSSEPINVTVTINGKQLTMELDTGAAVSIISDHTRRNLFSELKLKESFVVLKTYTEEPMKVVGQLNVQVKYGTKETKFVLVVIAGSGPSLYGRNWLKYLQLDWRKITSIRTSQ